MMEAVKKTKTRTVCNIIPDWFPGVILLVIVAFIAQQLGKNFPLIGGTVIAIFLGVFIRNGLSVKPVYEAGIVFTQKKLLKFAIILLGTSLSIAEVLAIGGQAITIIFIVVVAGILLTVWFGKLLKVDKDLGLRIGIGTAICGTTAITATKSLLDSKGVQVAYANSTIFLFNLIVPPIYPVIGHAFDMDQTVFGIWAGTAVHDTSSVLAVGYMYGDEAGEVATTVKLVRTLFLIPLMLIIGIWVAKSKQESGDSSTNLSKSIFKAFPWFVVGFIVMSVLNSFGIFPDEIKEWIQSFSKFLILMVMVGVGLQVEWKKMIAQGLKPVIVGLLASVSVAVISFVFIYILVV